MKTVGRATTYAVTCDFEWMPHGDDATELPSDEFTIREAKQRAERHTAQFPSHKTFRLWHFERALP